MILFNKGQLRNLAGATTFDRGEHLARNGEVFDVEQRGSNISARVQGSKVYQVSIHQGHEFCCTCPAAEYQSICKHAVATALVGLGEYPCGPAPSSHRLELPNSDAVKSWLLRQPRADLVAMLEHQWMDNLALFELLQHRCYVESQTKALSAEQIWALVEDAMPLEYAWEYEEATGYLRVMNNQLEQIEDWLSALVVEERFAVAWRILVRLNLVCVDYVRADGGEQWLLTTLQGQLAQAMEACSDTVEARVAMLLTVTEARLDHNDQFLLHLGEHAPEFCQLLKAVLRHPARYPKIVMPPWLAVDLSDYFSSQARNEQDWQAALDWLPAPDGYRRWLQRGELCLRLADYAQAEDCLRCARDSATDPYDHKGCVQFEIALAESSGDAQRHWRVAWAQFQQQKSRSSVLMVDEAAEKYPELSEGYRQRVLDLLAEGSGSDGRVVNVLIATALAYRDIPALTQWALAPEVGLDYLPEIACRPGRPNWRTGCIKRPLWQRQRRQITKPTLKRFGCWSGFENSRLMIACGINNSGWSLCENSAWIWLESATLFVT